MSISDRAEQGVSSEVDSTEVALEVVVMWGEQSVLHVAHLCPPRSFYVGDALDAAGRPGTDFLIGRETLGQERMPIALADGDSVAVVIARDSSCEFFRDGQPLADDEVDAGAPLLPCAEFAGASQRTLPPDVSACVRHGDFLFAVRRVQAAQRIGNEGPALRFSEQRFTLLSMALHLLLLGSFYFVPPRSSALSLDSLERDGRYVSIQLEPRATEDISLPELSEDHGESSGGDGRREAGEEGKMGKPDEPTKGRRYAIAGPPQAQPQLARDQALEVARNAGIIGVLRSAVGSWDAPTSPYGRDQAIGNDALSALGSLLGNEAGASNGIGGLGMIGTGRHGGGDAQGTIGVDIRGDLGHGRGGSAIGIGVGLHERGARVPPRVRSGQAEVRGSLSKEVIARIIHRHVNEVRNCYEQQLNSRPDLQGRVSIKFVIAPSGEVSAAGVTSSTLGHAATEQCIVQAVKRMSFPQPDGGGIVVVTYPFLLQQSE